MTLQRIDDVGYYGRHSLVEQLLHTLHDMKHKPVYELTDMSDFGELDVELLRKRIFHHGHSAYVVLHNQHLLLEHGPRSSTPAFMYVSVTGGSIGCQYDGEPEVYTRAVKRFDLGTKSRVKVPLMVLEHFTGRNQGDVDLVKFIGLEDAQGNELNEVFQHIHPSGL